MKRIGKLFGLAALAVIMGLSLAGCGGSGSGGETNLFDGLNTGTPGGGALAIADLTETDFNTIRNAGGADAFQGWFIEYGALHMVWANRTEAQFDALSAAVANIRGPGSRYVEEDNGNIVFFGNDFELAFFNSGVSDDGFFIAANTIIAIFEG